MNRRCVCIGASSLGVNVNPVLDVVSPTAKLGAVGRYFVHELLEASA